MSAVSDDISRWQAFSRLRDLLARSTRFCLEDFSLFDAGSCLDNLSALVDLDSFEVLLVLCD